MPSPVAPRTAISASAAETARIERQGRVSGAAAASWCHVRTESSGLDKAASAHAAGPAVAARTAIARAASAPGATFAAGIDVGCAGVERTASGAADKRYVAARAIAACSAISAGCRTKPGSTRSAESVGEDERAAQRNRPANGGIAQPECDVATLPRASPSPPLPPLPPFALNANREAVEGDIAEKGDDIDFAASRITAIAVDAVAAFGLRRQLRAAIDGNRSPVTGVDPRGDRRPLVIGRRDLGGCVSTDIAVAADRSAVHDEVGQYVDRGAVGHDRSPGRQIHHRQFR